jgi:cytochrome c-type biogenesis protein CcmH
VALANGRPDVSASHGEALVAANNGTVNEDAAKAFASALDRDPFDTKSLYYVGLRHAQQGDLKGAVQTWIDLAAVSPPEAPWLPTVREHIARASQQAGIDPAGVTSMMTLETPEDEARIREMVGRLEKHLGDDPDDEVGWRTLARTYRLLGEDTKAAEAEGTANALAATFREQQQRARELARQQTQPQPPGGPPQGTMQQVTPEDEERIRGMVQGLAERLEANPDDEQGWRMLARSYGVLGEAQKARDAQAKADALAAKRGGAMPPAPPATSPGPGPGPGQTLQGISPDDQARIRSMVQGLAERLAENPDDEQGWRMLARSYQVLGQPEKAAEALAKADALASTKSAK